MMRTNVSGCGRFVVLDGLHLDRQVFDSVVRWASEHDLRIQDAIQLALCAFGDGAFDRNGQPAVPTSSSRTLGRPRLVDSSE